MLRDPCSNYEGYVVADEDIGRVIERVRRGTGSRDVLAVCDYALARARVVAKVLDAKAPVPIIPVLVPCPVCEKKRAVKAAALRRYRAKLSGKP